MWTIRRRRELIKNIILAILCLAVMAGLFFALREVRAETEKERRELSQEYADQQNRQSLEKENRITDLEAEYQKDLDTVAQYLPGIVCWGDTLTAGSSGSVSYPVILQKYIDTHICEMYSFLDTVENADAFSLLDWSQYRIHIPVINMGNADEDTLTVLGRSGVQPLVLSEPVTIPSAAEPVKVSLSTRDGGGASLLCGGNNGVNPVIIDGIEGTLTLEREEPPFGGPSKSYYSFTRSHEGTAHPAAEGTPIVTAASEMYKDYIHVVCIGTYGGYGSANELVAQIRTLLSRQSSNSDRYLVLGICYQNQWKDMSAYDTALVQAFGDHYINIRSYLCSDGLSDAGITPTADDKRSAVSGIVPQSLRSSLGDAGLSAKAYKLLGKLVYERMELLGYFDEVNEELHITEAQKKTLKDDPDYFVRLIKSW